MIWCVLPVCSGPGALKKATGSALKPLTRSPNDPNKRPLKGGTEALVLKQKATRSTEGVHGVASVVGDRPWCGVGYGCGLQTSVLDHAFSCFAFVHERFQVLDINCLGAVGL